MRFVSTGRRNRNRTVSRPARSMLGQLSSQTRSVSENFSLFCGICLKWTEVCDTFSNHDQTIPHLPS
jgi:hypothetical protein